MKELGLKNLQPAVYFVQISFDKKIIPQKISKL